MRAVPVQTKRLSRPEPDAYVVRGSPRDYLHAAPVDPVLVVEVSDSRLAFDRGLKSAICACFSPTNGIQEADVNNSSQNDLKSTGGNGLFYCCAAQ